MKTTLTLVLLHITLLAQAQRMQVEDEQMFQRRLEFAQHSEDHLLILKNINGNVRVEGYNGDAVELEARQLLSARNQTSLQRAQEEVRLVCRTEGDIILIYPETPDVKAELRNRKLHYQMNQDDDDYQFHYDLVLRVPQRTSLDASTVNNGEVLVRKLSGKSIEIANVNGNVSAEEVSGLASASTVNGAVNVSYARVPEREAQFRTINGDITVALPPDADADVRFKSMNGDLYTDFDNLQARPAMAPANRKQGAKTTYRLDASTRLQINEGGPLLNFETLNGNVYVKKN